MPTRTTSRSSGPTARGGHGFTARNVCPTLAWCTWLRGNARSSRMAGTSRHISGESGFSVKTSTSIPVSSNARTSRAKKVLTGAGNLLVKIASRIGTSPAARVRRVAHVARACCYRAHIRRVSSFAADRTGLYWAPPLPGGSGMFSLSSAACAARMLLVLAVVGVSCHESATRSAPPFSLHVYYAAPAPDGAPSGDGSYEHPWDLA